MSLLEILTYGGKYCKAFKWIESISRETGSHALWDWGIDERIMLDTYHIRAKKSLLVI